VSGGKVAFTGGGGGTSGLYLAGTDGSGLTAIADSNHPAHPEFAFTVGNFFVPAIHGGVVAFYGGGVFDPSNGYNALYSTSGSFLYQELITSNVILPGDATTPAHTRFDVPSLSFDGSTLAFVADDANSPGGSADRGHFTGLYTLSVSGGALTRIIDNTAALPGLDPAAAYSVTGIALDAGVLAFSARAFTGGQDTWGIYMTKADGSAPITRVVGTGDALADDKVVQSVGLIPGSVSGGNIGFQVYYAFGHADGGGSGIYVATPGAVNPTLGATLLSDLNNRALAAGSTVTLTATAFALGETGLARVEFYADGVLFAAFDGAGNPLTSSYGLGNHPVRRAVGDPVGNKTVFQAAFQLPGIDKLINIIVRAVDKLGRSQVSSSVTVHSVVTADRPPLVALGSPSGGNRARVGVQLSVPASVSDPDAGSGSSADRNRPVRRAFEISGVVARVEYFINQLKAKDSAEMPFGLSFTPPAAGTYVLSAIATDGSGLAKISEPLIIVAATAVNLSVLGDGTAVEGGAKGKALFSRAGDTSGDLTVLYKTKGTAKNGKDYEKLSGSVVIPTGSDKFKLKIKPIDDAVNKGTRKITIQLLPSPTDDYDLGESTKAKLRLLDND
jgi:hypothetical protein